MLKRPRLTIASGLLLIACLSGTTPQAQQFLSGAHDPGVRGGAPGAGNAIAALTPAEQAAFQASLTTSEEIDTVPNGLGPRFNAGSCAQCHAQPATGGTS